ncbi:MlaD family protein [Paraconexibacter algicola]|uniref:Mce/MlaD domain-containing protein n=1 Tax=Paraconexibacter algicola TaxID=2133960 RepID=A0A2T4UEX5_9ACTN|nr:MlaD family protein [Paraconexibacter algicola]PTL56295.1 hypothetical protein C7Y72_15070 [Paraconexibacter algicola]
MRIVIERLRQHSSRIIAILALALAAIAVASILGGTRGSYEIKAQFDDVRGLIPGGAVRAAAVPVGTVKRVELVGDRPVVTMEIDDDYVLREGATADIQLFSNAGAVNRTIELTIGDPTKPRLRAGTVLRGPQTDQPVNFDDAAETLDAPTRANIKAFLVGLDRSLKGRGRDIDRTLRRSAPALNETANLLAQVNSDGQAVRTLVREGSRVTSALAASPADLGAAADRTATLLSVTAGRQAELRRSTQLLGPSLARGRTALASLATATPRLRTLVQGLEPVAREIEPFAKALPPALEAAGPFLVETRRLVRQAPGNLRAFRPIIRSASRVAPPLAPLIDEILPLGNALRAYIPETVGFFQNLGSTLGTYDANGHVLTLGVGLFPTPPGSTGKRLGPGDCGPGSLEKPYTRLPGTLACQPWADAASTNVGVERGR